MRAAVVTLLLNEPFKIAHGTSTQRQVVRGYWADSVAEAPLVPYYGEQAETVLAELAAVERIEEGVKEGTRAARLIVDVLQHQLAAKAEGEEVWEHLGLPDPRAVLTVRSLSIPTDMSVFMEQVKERASQYKTLKLKLGSGSVDWDEELVAKARETAPLTEIIADVNGGWSPQEAAHLCVKLERWGLRMIEQPISHTLPLEAWRELHSHRTSKGLPIFADESAQTAEDLPALSEWVQGVNVKVLKTAGITGALSMIQQAKAMRLRVMIGCMIESKLGIYPARQLAALGEWADLDGPLYLAGEG